MHGDQDRRVWVWRTAGALGALAVLLGAFGAHGLRDVVADPAHLEWWHTGARYHLAHALALVAVAVHPRAPRSAALLFIVGIILFSGSLYVMTLTGVRALGAITPLGGICLVGGWAMLAVASPRVPGAG